MEKEPVFVDIGGIDIDLDVFYIFRYLHDFKKQGFNEVTAGTGDYYTDAGNDFRFTSILAFYNQKNQEVLVYGRREKKNTREKQELEIFCSERQFKGILESYNIRLWNKITIDSLLSNKRNQDLQIELRDTIN